jgi:P-type Mg2+ transporter
MSERLIRADGVAGRRRVERPARHGRVIDPCLPLSALFEQLETDRSGLTVADAAARLVSVGSNVIDSKRSYTAVRELFRSVASPLALILLAAAVASVILGEYANAAIIATIVLLSGSINYWQSARTARAVQRLQSQVTLTATVLRDGKITTLARADVVVGDVIQLSAGDLVPADARLLDSTDLHVHQAALTGESVPVEKRATEGPLPHAGPDARELVFTGTSVVSGTAMAVVFATGQQTAFGDIVSKLAARPDETEFERGLRHFGMLILQTVTFLVLFILVVSIAAGRDAFQSLLFAVALAVGLTPEYLPMITTVTLAQGAVRMARQKVIVKHIASIQNLGSIDILCSDKTGTLTSGKMTLAGSLDPLGQPSERPLVLGHLNSTFETGVKSAFDAAILETAIGAEGFRKVAEVPFDFERRRLSVVVQKSDAQLLITKGAPESVLSCCSSLEIGGRTRAIEEQDRRRCLDLFHQRSADGLRVLAVAFRNVSAGDRSGRNEERNLTLVGFLTFADQLLEGVDTAIANLGQDGVEVKILSGDNELVARALCPKVGLDGTRIRTGDDIAHLDEAGAGARRGGDHCFCPHIACAKTTNRLGAQTSWSCRWLSG